MENISSIDVLLKYPELDKEILEFSRKYQYEFDIPKTRKQMMIELENIVNEHVRKLRNDSINNIIDL